MQQVECKHCGRTLEFAGDRPRFCGYCGQTLSTVLGQEDTLESPRPPSSLPDSQGSSPIVLRQSRESENLIGKTIGDFRVLREIGRGGMGIVYEAEQLASSRRVAIKFLGPSVPLTSAATERFQREGKLAASLSHPRTTFVFDAGELDGRYFIAMELMPGQTLRDCVEKDGPPSFERAVDWILDVLDGLEAAHRTGIVHRDVKPSNCFLDSEGRVKVGDFGLSKSLVGDVELTSGGGFMGTPLYAAPEQLRGGEITAKTDQYSLGATLFYVLCGGAPFVGDFATVIARIASEPAPTVRSLRAEIPADLSRIVARMLEKDPARRFTNLHEIRSALTPFGSGGTSIAALGRRLAAFSLDYIAGTIAASVITVAVVIVGVLASSAVRDKEMMVNLGVDLQVAIAIGACVYFVFFEGIWGRGLGKRLMGLRTVNLSGERVGFLRAGIRSLFYPGIFWAFAIWAAFATVSTTVNDASSAKQTALATLWSTLISVGGWLCSLLALVTMRSTNGYRGVHELLSDTRVMSVRSRRQGVSLRIPQTVAAATPIDFQLSGFELQHVVRQGVGYLVFAGRDTALERPVWVYVATSEEGDKVLASLPVHVSRPAREQWLRGGWNQGRRWQAFDAVSAIPLAHAVTSQGHEFRWGFRRALLLELAEELRVAVADGSLPPAMKLDQVLVDEQGRLKILNLPKHVAGDPESSESDTQTPAAEVAAHDSLVEAYRVCRGTAVIPLRDKELQTDLESKPPTVETLDWAVAQLRQAVKRPSRLRWDHRLGLLAISMFTEFSVYVTLIGVLALLPWLLPDLPLLVTLWIPGLLLAATPVALGVVLRGGPVFWFASVQVLNAKDGRLSGFWRCGWRSLVTWLPLIASMTGFAFAGMWIQNLESLDDNSNQAVVVALLLLLLAVLMFVMFVVGLIVALISPRRGIQDLLAGTVLMPKQ